MILLFYALNKEFANKYIHKMALQLIGTSEMKDVFIISFWVNQLTSSQQGVGSLRSVGLIERIWAVSFAGLTILENPSWLPDVT